MTEKRESDDDPERIEFGFAVPGTNEYIPASEILKDAEYLAKHPEDMETVSKEYPKYVSIHLVIPHRITIMALGISFFLCALVYFLTR